MYNSSFPCLAKTPCSNPTKPAYPISLCVFVSHHVVSRKVVHKIPTPSSSQTQNFQFYSSERQKASLPIT
ncbi:hypothetical protein EYC80_007639 [Monilinia laxa]|uniref:Uncharacterized protein n=1 Tax=Monilinia laxa TaxID=61186 RepID=A0A5N6JWI8_MONLA|nr:hypothetical protein EYC80_007639 [Monilinia laxa]